MDRMNELFHEPERDPELGEALRRLEAALTAPESEILRRRILAAARPKLARLGLGPPRWWEWISAWTRVAVPVGLAATLVAGLLVQGSDTSSAVAADGELGTDSTLVLAAFAEPESGNQLTAHLVVPEGSSWLFQQAVAQ
jgi:hypothetical protein